MTQSGASLPGEAFLFGIFKMRFRGIGEFQFRRTAGSVPPGKGRV